VGKVGKATARRSAGKIVSQRRIESVIMTEHGALMAANVLRSERAVKVSVFIVRAFVKLRETLSVHRELAHKLGELERKVLNHDQDIASLIHAVRELMSEPDEPRKPRIGYQTEERDPQE